MSKEILAVHHVTAIAGEPQCPQSARALWLCLSKTRFTVVSGKAAAELSLELIVDPHVRYGMFHYQNAPYVYLTVRKAPAGRLVYCSYQRTSHFRSASQRLLLDFEEYVHHTGTPPRGSMEACAEQAMRPL